ncbi:parallel beta-helix domain-containing protein [Myxococcaceae bacterium GXIMD 01537]
MQGNCVGFTEGAEEKAIQEAFVSAQSNMTLAFGEGTFVFENALVLESAEGVTVRGAGKDKTILDFKNQKAGGEGLSAEKTNNLTVKDLAVRDSKGDGIKVLGATGVHFQRVSVSWTGTNPTEHGGYGVYPVQCKKVLVEDSYVAGASDSGIYVGQSQDIVVRRNEVTQNVAGIEIENSHRADVYENNVYDNTGGVLVFGLPGLQQPDGHTVRVFKNHIHDNNHRNFAPAGNIVATVPRGTGVLVMANHDVEIFDNKIERSLTGNLAVISYLLTGLPVLDPKYSPFTWNVNIHGNIFTGGGELPDESVTLGLALKLHAAAFPNARVPDIIYDGLANPDPGAQGPHAGNGASLCVGQTTSFANLRADKRDAQTGAFTSITTAVAPYACTLTALPAVAFDGL